MNFFLYRHIRVDKNEPFYIGIGTRGVDNRIYQREYHRAFSSKNRNLYWRNIVAVTAYEVEIIFETNSEAEIIRKEQEFIRLYGRKDLKTGSLVNMTDGGGSLNMSPYQKSRIKKALTGRKLPPHVIEMMRKRTIGKKWSDEAKAKFSKYRTGRKHSQEVLEKIMLKKIKKCFQFSKDGVLVKEWNSRMDVTKHLRIDNSTIGRAIKEPKRMAGGFFWRSNTNF